MFEAAVLDDSSTVPVCDHSDENGIIRDVLFPRAIGVCRKPGEYYVVSARATLYC